MSDGVAAPSKEGAAALNFQRTDAVRFASALGNELTVKGVS